MARWTEPGQEDGSVFFQGVAWRSNNIIADLLSLGARGLYTRFERDCAFFFIIILIQEEVVPKRSNFSSPGWTPVS